MLDWRGILVFLEDQFFESWRSWNIVAPFKIPTQAVLDLRPLTAGLGHPEQEPRGQEIVDSGLLAAGFE